uniref:Methionyl/Valyl/Leucyl/Isoleucyl-tRNA synthetase anticodon-binding domain-containing protein n=1 Tax=Romanomermis culicivorax TaxID=13658 RepID=A0A915K717_ROMCU
MKTANIIKRQNGEKICVPACGVDGLRFWSTFSGAECKKIAIGPNILDEIRSRIKNLRIFLRFILGNLAGFSPETDQVSYEQLMVLDKFTLHLLRRKVKEIQKDYETYNLNATISKAYDFTQDLSSHYFSCIKDRLYCDYADGLARRSAQTVLYHLGDVFSRLIAPVLPHLAEEYFDYAPESKIGDAFKRGFPSSLPLKWTNEELFDIIFTCVRPLRKQFLAESGAKNCNELELSILAPFTQYKLIESLGVENLSEIFRVPSLKLILEPHLTECELITKKIDDKITCNRCRRKVCQNNDNAFQEEQLGIQKFPFLKNYLLKVQLSY